MKGKQIVVGSRVQYSRAFCRSTGIYTGDIPDAEGTVSELIFLSSETVLTRIHWDDGLDVPEKVLVTNLSLVGSIEND